MKMPLACVAIIALFLSSLAGTADATTHTTSRKLLQKSSGNNNGAGDGTSYSIPGDRNTAAIAVTSNFIEQAVAGNKANLAASVGSEAALTATKKSASLKVFDTLGSSGRRRLTQGRGASGNNNASGDGTSYSIPGDRNTAAIAVTSDFIEQAVAGNKANLAAGVGSEAALTATKRSAGLKVYDSLGSSGRKLMANSL